VVVAHTGRDPRLAPGACFGIFVFLGRFRQGALLKPLIVSLSRIGFMNRLFTKASTAAIERQNPELAGALKKLNSVAANPNPQAVQKAMSRLTPAERRAYMEAAAEQGTTSESANRQMRRQAERMQQPDPRRHLGRHAGGTSGGSSSTGGGRPGASRSSRKRKRR
jgi:biopolymer transport protein ExbB/TolQ